MNERRCQCIQTNRDDCSQRPCGKPATHSAYDPPMYLCDECLHEIMQDASPEEHTSIKKLP